MNTVLNCIPGYRSQTLWKSTIATLYYLISMTFAFSSIGFMLSALAIPFIAFGTIELAKSITGRGPAARSLASFTIPLVAFWLGAALTPPVDRSQVGNINALRVTPLPASTFALITPPIPVMPNAASSLQDSQRKQARVTRVMDGNTFEIEGGLQIRMIGINTPESIHAEPERNTAFVQRATTFSKEMLEGKNIYLEKDVSDKDQYGRLLRYVYLENGTFYNEYLALQGMAKSSTFPPDVKFAGRFVAAELFARENGNGLWSYEVTQSPSSTEAAAYRKSPR